MERTVGWFDQYGLFQQAAGNIERADAAAIKSISGRVEAWYDGFWDIAMKYNEGDVRAAEHFMDTGVYMFYYRIKQKAGYYNWKKENSSTN
jgi:hypothetical protein